MTNSVTCQHFRPVCFQSEHSPLLTTPLPLAAPCDLAMSKTLTNSFSVLRLITATPPLLLLSGCFEPEKTPVGYHAYNHTDKSIVSILVNGQGGVAAATAHGGGSEICCINLPNKWLPGLSVNIRWQEAGSYQTDEKGNVMVENGVPVLVKGSIKERTVEIRKYDQLGNFFMHFLPGDEVKVAVSLYLPGHPQHPYHFPDSLWTLP